MSYPKYWVWCIWTEADGHEVAGIERGFDTPEQVRNRARLLFLRQGGGEPWHGREITNLQVDALAKNDQWSTPVVIAQHTDPIPEHELVASRRDLVEALNALADKWGVPQ